ncbi:MAG TPA: hypothetical protein VKA65_08745 [Acidimicrobiales bacterium]|nr:hypothetical protein [Acidimicrobiales bacterium]
MTGTTAQGDAPHGDVAAPTPGPVGDDGYVFSRRARLAIALGSAVVGLVGVVASLWADGDKAQFVFAHAATALPFQAAAVALSERAFRQGPVDYRGFWRRWRAANLLTGAASVVSIVAVVASMPALLVVDVALLLASVPLWTMGSLELLKAHAGRLNASVDMVDGLLALVVLGAPGVLLVAEPLSRADEPLFAIPFTLIMVLAPAGVYGAAVEVARLPARDRVTQGIGLALTIVFAASISLQLAGAVDAVELPLAVYIGVHCVVMALVVAVPTWSHRRPTSWHADLPEERRVRSREPMPAVAAVVLAGMGTVAFLQRGTRPWGVAFVLAVAVVTVGLAAVRDAALRAEARGLQAGLADMSEERRQLIASMLSAFEADRERTASELHAQVVGSLSTLATVARTASVTLPADTARTVTETVAMLQADLADRAEELRRLMAAMRTPSLPGGSDATLAAALRAYASDLADGRGRESAPAVTVRVDPALRLDWATMTIAYRIAQEAIFGATRHGGARSVAVSVSAVDGGRGGVEVSVSDDGGGIGSADDARRSGLRAVELFTQLGRGDLVVDARGGRTVIRARLGVPRRGGGGEAPERLVPVPRVAAGARSAGEKRRHLRLVPADAPPAG